jgi:hypothetical protein
VPAVIAFDVNETCQAPWLASVMWSAGAVVDGVEPCPNRPGHRVVMRMSELGYAAVFDVSVCDDHLDNLRRSPYHVTSEALL